VWIAVNNEFERIGKLVIVANFKVSQYLHLETEENEEKTYLPYPVCGTRSIKGRLEYSVGVLLLGHEV
jgi:hypothetical protein